MLWVNLIMDSLASLALATEMPTEEHLKRPPIGRNKSMISGIMWWNIIGHSFYQLTVLNIILFAAPSILKITNGAGQGHSAEATEHNTLIFNSFVLIQLFNQINARKLHHEWNIFEGLWSNRVFLSIVIIEIGVQVIIVEFGGPWFHTKSLSSTGWIIGLTLAILVFPMQYVIIWLASLFRRVGPFRPRMTVVPIIDDAAESLDMMSIPLGQVATIGSSTARSFVSSSEPVDQDLVATTLVKTKRHEALNSLAKGMTKHSDSEMKRELAKAGHEFQRMRKSTSVSKEHLT
jgi:hypothetical protein